MTDGRSIDLEYFHFFSFLTVDSMKKLRARQGSQRFAKVRTGDIPEPEMNEL